MIATLGDVFSSGGVRRCVLYAVSSDALPSMDGLGQGEGKDAAGDVQERKWLRRERAKGRSCRLHATKKCGGQSIKSAEESPYSASPSSKAGRDRRATGVRDKLELRREQLPIRAIRIFNTCSCRGQRNAGSWIPMPHKKGMHSRAREARSSITIIIAHCRRLHSRAWLHQQCPFQAGN